ncbi:MAG: hypothetical protein ISS34_02270 [Candidatus Omnitrophica bacterium]|nr:hypothetical protein [Candidatus Omnitrophota bacterium]
MTKDSSPEEKLLNLIKKRKKEKALPKTDYFQAALPKSRETASQRKEDISSMQFLKIGSAVTLENIRRLNTILFAVLIMMLLYFIVELFLIPNEKIPAIEEGASRRALGVVRDGEPKPYSYYSKNINKEIFRPLVKEERRNAEPKVPLEELMNNLSLLGIISGEQPQAIIEDKKVKKTFFLREGQSASGIFLKKIHDGTVTIVYKGEEFILTM